MSIEIDRPHPGPSAASGNTRWHTVPSAPGTPATARAARHAAAEADRVGRDLQAAFAGVLSRLPAGVGKVAQITRWLDLDRSICQRIVLGVRDATDGLGVLERFPGVRGLEQFVAAAESRGIAASAVAAARKAVTGYARLVADAGGSQTRLVDRIGLLRAEGDGRAAAPSPTESERQRLRGYEAAVGMTGLSSAARVEVVLVGPTAGAPATSTDPKVTTLSATGFIGVEAAPWAMPLTRRSRLPGLTPVPANPAATGLTPDLLLADFTSQPHPRVTTRPHGEALIQTFDTEPATLAPVDIVAALSFDWTWGQPRPASEPNFYSVGRIIGAPTRRLILDVYLHASLPPARAVTAHVLRPGTLGSLGNHRPQDRWFDRIPTEHDLKLLAGPPGSRPADGYPRLGELTQHLLTAQGWAGQPFTGYRLEVTYPVFDFEYIIAAEY